MPSRADVAKVRAEKQARSQAKSAGRFKVATTSPFTVYLDGGSTAVPGLPINGLSYSVGTKGHYSLMQGQLPLCFPTA